MSRAAYENQLQTRIWAARRAGRKNASCLIRTENFAGRAVLKQRKSRKNEVISDRGMTPAFLGRGQQIRISGGFDSPSDICSASLESWKRF